MGDPFGGNLTRRTVVSPNEEKPEKAASFKEKREELQKTIIDGVDRAALEFESARIKNETAKLQLEYQNIQRQLGAPEAVAAAAVPVFGGTTAALMELLQLGHKLNIDVTPLIRQTLTGQQLTPLTPLAQPPVDPMGVPNWLGGALGKILEKSYDNNNKQPQESAAVAVLQEKMRTQELLINKELEGIKNLLMQRGGDVDPNKAAVDNVKNLALLISTVKSLSPEPPAAPVTANSGELAFKYQDRQWQHEEKKIEAELKKQEIAAQMHVEQQKLEQSKNNLAQIPEMIGAVVAQSLMEKNKSAAPAVQAQAPNKEPFSIKLSKSKGVAHGPITIKCPDCKSDVSFMTSAKQANCINCGLVFRIQLTETEGGSISVESDQPEAQQTTQERPPSDGYLLRGM